MKFFIFAALTIASLCFAQSGSDILLNQLGEKASVPTSEVKRPMVDLPNQAQVNVRPRPPQDGFQKLLLKQADREDSLSFEVNEWVQEVSYADYAKAAHQWTSIQAQIPAHFRIQAEATQVYLLWKIGLQQTFINEWIRNLSNSAFVKSQAESVLEELVTPGFDAVLLHSPVVLTPKQVSIIEKSASTKSFMLTLLAMNAIRTQGSQKALLAKLPPENKLTHYLAEREVYARAKAGDLKGAAWAVKNYIEPTDNAAHDPELIAEQNLTVARILYQAGQLKVAQEFYEKVPNQSKAYLAAREELVWIYLRTGDMATLRGQLQSLASPLFKEKFQPETYLPAFGVGPRPLGRGI